jgi:hypothetical protein
MTLDELGSPVFIQRLVISLLTEEGFDAASKLAMCESVAQGFLPQKLTNEAVLLTRRNTLVRVGRLFPALLARKSFGEDGLRHTVLIGGLVL